MPLDTAPQACLHCGTLTTLEGPYCCGACRLLHDNQWVPQARDAGLDATELAFEDESLRGRYDLSGSADSRRYHLYVEGLQCSSCVHLIENLPQYLRGVRRARLNFAQSELHVETDAFLSLGRLLGFLRQMGYPSHPLTPEEDQSELHRREDRDLLRRLAVAGACAGNIMLFTVPIYGGLQGPLEFVFHGVSFLLFLPVLVYSALPIYRGAWAGLKNRSLNVDVPLSIAFLASFIASTVNWLRGSPGVYFDSGAGFLFLILVSRWFLKNSQRRWIQGPLSQRSWFGEFLKIQTAEGEKLVAADRVEAGHILLLNQQQIVPVDGELRSSHALFDPSWMNGESLPKTLSKGMAVPAGYRLLSPRAEILARTKVKDSELMRGLSRLENESLWQSRRVNDFDRASRTLLLVVLCLGALILAIGPAFFGLSFNDAFERALSLLIVACPCALAFGGPLAYAMALRQAARRGLLIKNADVLDRVAECRTLLFDKTGTLTEGRLQLVRQTPADVPPWMKDLILNLERHSHHPVAFAFREAWSTGHGRHLDVRDVHEIPGEKIFGLFEGAVYSLKAATARPGGLQIVFMREQTLLAEFEFEDRPRPESAAILKQLAPHFRLSILSGDREDRVRSLIHQLQVPGLEGRGDCKPHDKALAARDMQPALMIGDGVNDAEAFAAAHVGVAVNGSLEQGLRHASVYFLSPGLAPLRDLLRASRQARRLVRRNLFFALFYNVIAGAAAVAGWINPLVAAVLMPVSSLLILFSTWEASR